MSWLGVPYPFVSSNLYEAGLTVTKLPEVMVNTGFSWDTVLGAVLGAVIGGAIPASIAWYSIKKNRESAELERTYQRDDFVQSREAQLQDIALARESQIQDVTEARLHQTELAKMALNAQVLSANRQQWINSLREHCANFVSLSEMLKYAVKMSLDEIKNVNSGRVSDALLNAIIQKTLDYNSQLITTSASIDLMLNPSELTSRAMIYCKRKIIDIVDGKEQLDELFKPGSQLKSDYEYYLKVFIRASQRCLKNEWRRVKAGL